MALQRIVSSFYASVFASPLLPYGLFSGFRPLVSPVLQWRTARLHRRRCVRVWVYSYLEGLRPRTRRKVSWPMAGRCPNTLWEHAVDRGSPALRSVVCGASCHVSCTVSSAVVYSTFGSFAICTLLGGMPTCILRPLLCSLHVWGSSFSRSPQRGV